MMSPAMRDFTDFTTTMWKRFWILLGVSVVLGIATLVFVAQGAPAAVFFSLVSSVAGVVSSLVLGAAVLSSVMVRHAAVVAESGGGPAAAPPAVKTTQSMDEVLRRAAIKRSVSPERPADIASAPAPSAPAKTLEPELTSDDLRAEPAHASPVHAAASVSAAHASGNLDEQTPRAKRRIALLTESQRAAWVAAGMPNIMEWDGTDFDQWLSTGR